MQLQKGCEAFNWLEMSSSEFQKSLLNVKHKLLKEIGVNWITKTIAA
jgi:hypothetical protein